MLTAAQLAKSGSEHAHQQAVFAWLNQYCPSIRKYTFAIPNGATLASTGDKRSAAIRGSKLVAEGMTAGVPDLMCATCRHGFAGLFIEMKKLKSGRVSDLQRDMHVLLTANLYAVRVCYTWQECVCTILEYHGIMYVRHGDDVVLV